MTSPALMIYFDGRCALCIAEMQRLGRWDAKRRLAFADIAEPGFDPSPLGVDLAALNRELHVRTADGRVLTGIDSFLAAYTLVGRGWMVWPLRIGALRGPFTRLYRSFARHRYSLSHLLSPLSRRRVTPACDGDVCGIGNPFLKSAVADRTHAEN